MTNWIFNTINATGYFGIFLLMFIENVFPPIPSEFIMPLAGFMVASNKFTLLGVILAGTLGAVVGGLPLYYLGAKLGKERVKNFLGKHGKWLMLYPEDIDKASGWFSRHGGTTVFFCRLIPGIRSLISIPAGFNRMPVGRFLLLSFLGSFIWTAVLVLAGYFLGTSFGEVEKYLDPFVYAVLGLVVFFYLWRLLRYKKAGRRQLK